MSDGQTSSQDDNPPAYDLILEKNISMSKPAAFCSSSGQHKSNSRDLDLNEFEDETLIERLIGLTEMFPEPIRNFACSSFKLSYNIVEKAYAFSRSSAWFLASTASLCFFPLILEIERVQTEEQEAVQQRTMMLGPRAAGGGTGLAGFSANVPHLSPKEPK